MQKSSSFSEVPKVATRTPKVSIWGPWQPQKPLKTIGFSMVSWSSRFCYKLDLGIKKVWFLDLKITPNRSSGEQNRVPKSIRILGRKKEGPKSRKVRSKSKVRTGCLDILDPRVLGNEHCLWWLDTSKSMLLISQRLWAKARRIYWLCAINRETVDMLP